ncbi:hypothetical protein BDW66DRAFT_144835 [Aspergillus desertorum]
MINNTINNMINRINKINVINIINVTNVINMFDTDQHARNIYRRPDPDKKEARKKDRRKNKGSTQSSEGIRSLVGYGRVVDTVLFCPPSHEHMLFHNRVL